MISGYIQMIESLITAAAFAVIIYASCKKIIPVLIILFIAGAIASFFTSPGSETGIMLWY